MSSHHDPLRRAALRAALAVSTLSTAGALTTTGCTVETQVEETLVAEDTGGDATGDATGEDTSTTSSDTRQPPSDTGPADTGPSDTGQPPSDVGPSDTSVAMDTAVPPSDTTVPPSDTTTSPDAVVDTTDPGDTAIADTADLSPTCGELDGLCAAGCDFCSDPDCCVKEGYNYFVDSYGWCPAHPECFEQSCCEMNGGTWTVETSYWCDGCGVPGPFMPPRVRV